MFSLLGYGFALRWCIAFAFSSNVGVLNGTMSSSGCFFPFFVHYARVSAQFSSFSSFCEFGIYLTTWIHTHRYIEGIWIEWYDGYGRAFLYIKI